MRFGNFWNYGFTINGSKSDFALRSKTEGLKQTGPNLDRDWSGPNLGPTVLVRSGRLTFGRSLDFPREREREMFGEMIGLAIMLI